MQLRRVLLLFALVLGLSALVASLAPPPADRDDEKDAPAGEPTPRSPAAGEPTVVRFTAHARGGAIPTRRVAPNSRLSVDVSVAEPGDVELDGVGLRQPADPHTPAHFDLLAPAKGRSTVTFQPVSGSARSVGRLEFRPRRYRR